VRAAVLHILNDLAHMKITSWNRDSEDGQDGSVLAHGVEKKGGINN
jgi:hypothetical protein